MWRAVVPTGGFFLPNAHVPPVARGPQKAALCTEPGRGPLALPFPAAHCSGSFGWRKAGTVTKEGPGPLWGLRAESRGSAMAATLCSLKPGEHRKSWGTGPQAASEKGFTRQSRKQ